MLFEKDLNTGVVTKRFYANGLQVTKMVGSTVSYLHEDNIGSIRFISSAKKGSQVFSSNYVPYGPQYGATGTPDEFLSAGKIYDGSRGFYYFGARYYDPTIGRFVTTTELGDPGTGPTNFGLSSKVPSGFDVMPQERRPGEAGKGRWFEDHLGVDGWMSKYSGVQKLLDQLARKTKSAQTAQHSTD